MGAGRLVWRADRRREPAPRHAGIKTVQAVARAGVEVPQRRAAAAWRDLAHVLPERDGGVVPARARDLHALSAWAREVPERGGVLLPRGDRALRAGIHRR